MIGLGAMGSEIARLLLQSGRGVTVWNRTSAKAEPLVEAGATLASSAAEAIAASEVTIVCVYDYAAAKSILETDDVAAAIRGRTVVQLTTGAPLEAREAEAWAHEHGGKYLEGALQVAPEQMAKPDTTILLSGAREVFESAEPLLRTLGGNLVYLGEPIGASSAMDLATLSCLYGALLGFFHGVLICEAEGFGASAYGSIVAQVAPNFGEFLRHEGGVIESGDFAVSQSPLAISVEATTRLLHTARESGISTEFPAFASGILQRAEAAGHAGEELAAIVKVLRPKP